MTLLFLYHGGQTVAAGADVEVRFNWNSSPVKHVVCAYPYILAFSPDTLEFQSAVNGSLLHTNTFPELKLLSGKVPSSAIFLGRVKYVGQWPGQLW